MEYKVIQPNLGFRKHDQKLQEILNNESLAGWRLHTLSTSTYGNIILVFEREKHR